MDADALDHKASRRRQLSVELVLHDLVVSDVPALFQRNAHLIRSSPNQFKRS